MIGPVERRLVTSFDELRSGMTVVAVACRLCGGEHEAMLTVPAPGRPDAWLWAPTPGCGFNGVAAIAIDQRRLLRLVDPALEPADVYADDLEVVAVEAAERARRVPVRAR